MCPRFCESLDMWGFQNAQEKSLSNIVVVDTDSAPEAIGPYSQGIKVGNLIWISGQISLNPKTMELVDGDFVTEAKQVFKNIAAIAEEAGGTLDSVVKLNISLTDLRNFEALNEIMSNTFSTPYPARACVGVSELPRGARIEVEAILAI